MCLISVLTARSAYASARQEGAITGVPKYALKGLPADEWNVHELAQRHRRNWYALILSGIAKKSTIYFQLVCCRR